MTEKRFTMEYKVYRDNLTGEIYNEVTESYKICDLLNNLHEENEKLKREFDSCSHNWALMYDEAKEKVEALTKENWELKQELAEYRHEDECISEYM